MGVSEKVAPPGALATLIIPLVHSEVLPVWRRDLFGGRQVEWVEGPLGRLSAEEHPQAGLQSHGLRIASYSAAASPFTMQQIYFVRHHIDRFDQPIRLSSFQPRIALHSTETQVFENLSINAVQYVPLSDENLYLWDDDQRFWHSQGSDLLVLHVHLAGGRVTEALRLLLRTGAPLASALITTLFDNSGTSDSGLPVRVNLVQRVGVGVALHETTGDGGFERDESGVVWDRQLNPASEALLNGRLTNVAVAAAVQFFTLSALQVHWPTMNWEEADWRPFRSRVRSVRHSLLWPVVDFSAAAQSCYRELREALFLPQLSEAMVSYIDEAHQHYMEQLQQESNASAERLARAGNKLAWAGGVLAVISVLIGVMQVVLAIQAS